MAVWGLCSLLFWYLEFGSIFLLGTGFALIFANLGDTRREGDMSAWVRIKPNSLSCSSCLTLSLTRFMYLHALPCVHVFRGQSVFNQGFTTMLGTLSAEQMDREIRHRNLHDNDDDE